METVTSAIQENFVLIGKEAAIISVTAGIESRYASRTGVVPRLPSATLNEQGALMKSNSNANGPMNALADRIRAARRAVQMSQAELAESLSVASSAVAQWESPNGTTPRIEKIAALASAIGVSVDWLVTGRGDKRRNRLYDEVTPAITPDSFARDIDEELLLKQFRRLQPRARELFMGLLTELGARR